MTFIISQHFKIYHSRKFFSNLDFLAHNESNLYTCHQSNKNGIHEELLSTILPFPKLSTLQSDMY